MYMARYTSHSNAEYPFVLIPRNGAMTVPSPFLNIEHSEGWDPTHSDLATMGSCAHRTLQHR